MVRLGQTEPAGQFLDGLGDTDREHGEVRLAEAAPRLAQGDPRAATVAIAPVLEGSAPVVWENGRAHAYVLEAIARELSVSPNTVKTHVRHVYAKFGTHHRAEAVELTRALGLLAPSRTARATR